MKFFKLISSHYAVCLLLTELSGNSREVSISLCCIEEKTAKYNISIALRPVFRFIHKFILT
jgi:hypothetical protein